MSLNFYVDTWHLFYEYKIRDLKSDHKPEICELYKNLSKIEKNATVHR